VAEARKLPLDRVLALIDANTERSGAIIGAPPRVNVLKLNRLLDEEKPVPQASAAPDPNSSGAPPGPTTSTEPEQAKEVAALRTQIKGLSDQLDQLGKQIETSQDDKTVGAVKDLEARVGALAESARNVSALGPQVGRIDERVKQTGETLEKLRTELEETRAALKQRAPDRTEPPRRP
jgi:hypothetical protein